MCEVRLHVAPTSLCGVIQVFLVGWYYIRSTALRDSTTLAKLEVLLPKKDI